MKKFYITTPIYYPSGELHIGHAYTTTLADFVARYKRERGYDVYYLTGTDEHGEKIQQKAIESGITEKEYLDGMVNEIKKLWEALDINYDQFIRTTNEDHKEVVQKIFSKMVEKGDIYLGNYEGYYCTPCESFWTEGQLDENHNCPDCNREVQLKKEESYFFNMKKYQPWIEDLFNKREEKDFFLQPISRSNEMYENFIKDGIQDLAVSRTSFDWGVPIKDTNHVVYVWLDALTNYITALGYDKNDHELFDNFWGTKDVPADSEIVHLVGKEIVRFHGIYWPIFLESLNLRQPTKLYAHGWIIMKDGKMSKSKGNVINPYQLINAFGADATKFYLIKEIQFGKDGVFTPELFIESYNAHLVNSLSNLIHRTQTMFIKNFGDGIENEYVLDELMTSVLDYANEQIQITEESLDNFEINKAADAIFSIIARLNKYIDESQPWVLAQENDPKLKDVLLFLSDMIVNVSILIRPMLPETSEKISSCFQSKENVTWKDASNIGNFSGKINEMEPMFQRIKLEDGLELLK